MVTMEQFRQMNDVERMNVVMNGRCQDCRRMQQTGNTCTCGPNNGAFFSIYVNPNDKCKEGTAYGWPFYMPKD
jgi:hypothetical protein